MPMFPVLVDEQITHVVWYEADDKDAAVRMAKGDPVGLDACLGTHTRAAVDLRIYAPADDLDLDLVRQPSSFGYKGEAAIAA